MENSIVREFKNFGKSNFSNFNQSGCIQTLHEQNNLGKSRIQNLPSYRRQNLSSKLDLVVVFQTIEIERLSIEIQALRVKLKDSQRQIMNFLSYQIQIKQLTQSCMRLQQQSQTYQAQVEKLNLICQKMYCQLQEMHQKYDQISLQLPSKCKILNDENINLQETIKRISKDNQLLQQEREERQRINKQKEQQLKKKIVLFSQQITRLNATILDSKRFYQDIQKNNQLLTIQLSKFQQELQTSIQLIQAKNQIIQQFKQLQKIANAKVAQINQLKSKIDKLLQNYSTQQNKSKQADLLLQQNMKSIESMNLSLNNQINLLQQQLQVMKRKLQTQQIQLEKQQNIKIQLKSQFQKADKEKSKQLTLLRQQVKKCKSILQKTDSNIILLLKQIQDKQAQISQFKINFNNYQSLCLNNQKLQEKCSLMIAQLQKNYIELDKQKNNSHNMQKQIFENQCKVNQKNNEINHLNNHNKNLEVSKQKMIKQQIIIEETLRNKLQQFKKLQISLSQEQKANKQLKLILAKQQNQLKLAKQQLKNIKQLKNQNDSLIKQLTNLKTQSLQKEMQINMLKDKIFNIEQFILKIKETQIKREKQLNQANIKLKKINQVFSVNEILVEKILNFQNQISILQNQNMKLSGENKVMNFQMVQTHKINTMYKRRDSTKTTSSIKSQNQSSIINSQNSGDRQILQSLIVRN